MDSRTVPVVPAPEPPLHPTPASPPPRRPRLLFPPGLAHPAVLIWAWIVPQALLFWLNLDAWSLASGEAGPRETTAATTIFVGEILTFATGIGIAAWHAVTRRQLSRIFGVALLVVASIQLAIVLLHGNIAIPAALHDWIIPPDQWSWKQFALIMPGALYGAFRAICPDHEDDPFAGAVLTLLTLSAPFFLGFFVIAAISSVGGDRGASHIFLPIYFVSASLFAASILRLCASTYVACRRSSPVALATLTAVLAIGLPLGGLALNAAMPFPVDFQIPLIYALAIANGVVLCLPNFAHPVAHRIVWLLQCALLPFTLYFFAVFLPQLPLLPLAALFMGLGLLMAVPSALFLLHGYRLIDGWKMELRDGPRWIPATLGICAFAVGPVYLTARVLADRHSLHQALDYLAYPDYSRAATFDGDRAALRSALLRMRDFKQGHYLPYYSEFYNALAFDRLVLPQTKMDETWLAFTGTPMPEVSGRTMAAPFSTRSRARNAQEVLTGPVGARPTVHAVTSSIRTTTAIDAGLVRALAQVTIQNPTGAVTEYHASLNIPDGVLVTGMWLTIGADRVPARLYDQRAAEWVYQKITETRPVPQDPAILRFTGPNAADLRVYPVDANGRRFVEIEFSYPDNLAPAITLDSRALELPPPTNRDIRIAGNSAWIPVEAVRETPSVLREPQPHLLIDTSLDSALRDPSKMREAIDRAIDTVPSAKTARLTFANFGLHSFRDGAVIPLEEIRQLDPEVILREAGKFEGGFLEARAIKYALTQSTTEPSVTRWQPAIVVVRGSPNPPANSDTGHLADFARLAPDVPGYWTQTPGTNPQFEHFVSGAPETLAPIAIRVVKLNGEFSVVRADSDAFVQSSSTGGSLAIWDPSKSVFVPLPATPIATLSKETHAWELASRRILEPWRHGRNALARLVQSAKDANVLVPGTAMMVVENTAQWKMLERTEKKALKGHDAMTLSETPATGTVPEPSTILLLVIGALVLVGWKWRQRIALSRRGLP